MFNTKLLSARDRWILDRNIYYYHGFKIYRHNSNKATCIEYKSADGSMKVIAVMDSRFRNTKKFGTYEKETYGLKDFQSAGTQSWWIDTANVPQDQPMPDRVTNDSVYSNWSTHLLTDYTAKENCDLWMEYNTITDTQSIVGVPAVVWCRSQSLDGVACDLPNLYQLCCIWACGDQIDRMDPYYPDYPNLGLGYTSNKGDSGFGRTHTGADGNSFLGNVWSSTKYSHMVMRHLHYNGCCGNDSHKYHVGLAIPIIELTSKTTALAPSIAQYSFINAYTQSTLVSTTFNTGYGGCYTFSNKSSILNPYVWYDFTFNGVKYYSDTAKRIPVSSKTDWWYPLTIGTNVTIAINPVWLGGNVQVGYGARASGYYNGYYSTQPRSTGIFMWQGSDSKIYRINLS